MNCPPPQVDASVGPTGTPTGQSQSAISGIETVKNKLILEFDGKLTIKSANLWHKLNSNETS